MTSQTTGRLQLFTQYAHPEIRREDDSLIAEVMPDLLADARRLVACWNACDGIDTESIEEGDRTTSVRLMHQIRELRIQREELLKVITRLSAAAAARDNTMGDQCGVFAAQDELRDANKLASAAIAKSIGAL